MTAVAAKLPVASVARQHRWPYGKEKRIAHVEFADGNARTERTCEHCGLVKITVHGGNRAWREWRTKDGQFWQGTATPPCLGPSLLEGNT